jgi:thiol:disulfide interchange protein
MKKALLLLLLFPVLLSAQIPFSRASEGGPVTATMMVEESGVESGRPFWVAIRLDMKEGWHTYWKNPGDSGFATTVVWNLPDGFTADEVEWPAPSRFEHNSVISFGYEDEAVLMARIHPPANLTVGDEIELAADVSWLACRDSCMPGFSNVTHSVKVVTTASEVAGQTKALFGKWRGRLPQKLLMGNLSVEGDRVLVHFPQAFSKSVKGAYFIPEKGDTIDYSSAQEVEVDDSGLSLILPRKGDGKVSEMNGLLVMDDSVAYTVQASTASSKAMTGFGLALLFAFFGGMILNLMPCVLPVISLKVMSFVEMSRKGRAEGLRHGLAFTLGVLMSFWMLAGALLVLRAYGEGVGWGFQLQEPVFVAILAGVIFLLGLSLFGLFEMGTSLISLGSVPSKRKGAMGSFLTGILATAVATPCTGPLLGPALGYAVTLPVFHSLLIFSSIAVGLSFPYLLLAAVPEWLRFLPKPGNWMITFKQIMGFMMMATLVWLLWVFSAEVGSPIFVIGLIASLLLMSVGAWVYGKWGTPVRKKAMRYTMRATALVLIGCAFLFSVQSARVGGQLASHSVEAHGDGWVAWDPEKVAELQASGVPIFIDFTAKWCLTCQVNKGALHSSEVKEAFKRLGVVAMEADWTKRDPRITKKLAGLGRSGVPVYVYYSGNPGDEPVVLPQVLTANGILKAIEHN